MHALAFRLSDYLQPSSQAAASRQRRHHFVALAHELLEGVGRRRHNDRGGVLRKKRANVTIFARCRLSLPHIGENGRSGVVSF